MTLETTPALSHRRWLIAAASAVAEPGCVARQSATPPRAAVRFTGDPAPTGGCCMRGARLLAVTLGIYRFWLATDMRRFLWANTEVAGDNAGIHRHSDRAADRLSDRDCAAGADQRRVRDRGAQHGSGRRARRHAARFRCSLFFLGQFAVYRARRYRLTRTVYRGVRCHQNGSALRYAVCAVFWWSLVVLTLGLAYPFAQSRLERFKMRHTYFGDLHGRFEGSGFRLFLRGLPMWFLVMGPLVFGIIAALACAQLGRSFRRSQQQQHSVTERFRPRRELASLRSLRRRCRLGECRACLLLFPVFQAMVLRWWISGLRLGALTVHSQLRTAHDLRRLSALSRLRAASHAGHGRGRRHRPRI